MPGLLSEHRLAGFLLVLALLSFAVGAGLPTVGPRGNMNIFNLPVREHLLAVAGNAATWRWANVFMGVASVLLVAGLTMLTVSLEDVGDHVLSRLGLVGILLATILWLAFSAFRATVTLSASQELATTGTVPPYYAPLAGWSSGLFLIYAVVGFLALASYGGAVVQSTLLPSWAGWVIIFFSIAMLAVLIVAGDTLPILHYLPALLLGILLLARG